MSSNERKRQLDFVQLIQDSILHFVRYIDVSTKTQANHRVLDRPVPVRVDIQTSKQGFIALEQLLQCIRQETFAETTRTGEKVENPSSIICRIRGVLST